MSEQMREYPKPQQESQQYGKKENLARHAEWLLQRLKPRYRSIINSAEAADPGDNIAAYIQKKENLSNGTLEDLCYLIAHYWSPNEAIVVGKKYGLEQMLRDHQELLQHLRDLNPASLPKPTKPK